MARSGIDMAGTWEIHLICNQTRKWRCQMGIKENPKEKFTSLIHLLNAGYLKNCYKQLKGGKAAGVPELSRLVRAMIPALY